MEGSGECSFLGLSFEEKERVWDTQICYKTPPDIGSQRRLTQRHIMPGHIEERKV